MKTFFKPIILLLFCINLFLTITLQAQIKDSVENYDDYLDSLYIAEIENIKGKDKVLHAEPLFIDLIRDLGARKGEKEWNVGLGLTDNVIYDQYTTLVEYEFAPIDRLGLEIELPFSFYYPTSDDENIREQVPSNKLNSLKLAAQWSFYVSEKNKTSMAIGYIHEFELVDFADYGKKNAYKGNIYNPFFIIAKRWGQNFHNLVYTGFLIEEIFKDKTFVTNWEINTNIHYMVQGTRNFIGVEINKNYNFNANKFDIILRPQLRVAFADNFLIGIVTGVPVVDRGNERLSSFLRIIYEPGHKQHTKTHQ